MLFRLRSVCQISASKVMLLTIVLSQIKQVLNITSNIHLVHLYFAFFFDFVSSYIDEASCFSFVSSDLEVTPGFGFVSSDLEVASSFGFVSSDLIVASSFGCVSSDIVVNGFFISPRIFLK